MKFVCVLARSKPAFSLQIISGISFSKEGVKEFSVRDAAIAMGGLHLLTVILCIHFISYFGHTHFLHKHTPDI